MIRRFALYSMPLQPFNHVVLNIGYGPSVTVCPRLYHPARDIQLPGNLIHTNTTFIYDTSKVRPIVFFLPLCVPAQASC